MYHNARTHNDVNEITEWDPFAGNSQENPVTPTYDDAGNLTEDGNDILYIYDAWNRLVVAKRKVGQTENILGMYAYDGLGRRIRTAPVRKRLLLIVANTEHEFYTRSWQRIEARPGGENSTTGVKLFVYGIRYIDDIVLRIRDAIEAVHRVG